jgi:hypothetical protein
LRRRSETQSEQNEESIERQTVLLRDQEYKIQVYERHIRDIETLSATPPTLPEECGTSPEQPTHKAAVDGGEEGIHSADRVPERVMRTVPGTKAEVDVSSFLAGRRQTQEPAKARKKETPKLWRELKSQ